MAETPSVDGAETSPRATPLPGPGCGRPEGAGRLRRAVRLRWNEEWPPDRIGQDRIVRRHYRREALAHRLKTRIQQVIGICGVALLITRVLQEVFDPTKPLDDKVLLRVAAITLSAATVVELSYTLFTPGPDEALNPLLLGLSSSLLFLIASQQSLTWESAGGAFLLVGAIGLTFWIREHFIVRAPDP